MRPYEPWADPEPDGDDPADLATAFNRVADQLEKVRKGGRTNRILIGIVFVLLIAGGVGGWQIHVNTAAASTAAAQAHKAQQQEAIVVRKICVSFDKIARLKPPSQAVKGSQSRIYLDKEHAAFDEFGTDLGCHSR